MHRRDSTMKITPANSRDCDDLFRMSYALEGFGSTAESIGRIVTFFRSLASRMTCPHGSHTIDEELKTHRPLRQRRRPEVALPSNPMPVTDADRPFKVRSGRITDPADAVTILA